MKRKMIPSRSKHRKIMKDYIEKQDESAERRFFSPQIELRAEGDDQFIEGIAATIDSETDLGWYREKISRGAFDDVMNDDVVALFNHDPNFPLARTGAGLDLFITKEGHLGYRYKTPNTTTGRDLAENIRTGVISKSSFAFTIEKDEWKEEKDNKIPDVRTITKLKRLYDVSPVTYPAYQSTSVTTVAARSLEKFHKPEIDNDTIQRDSDLRSLELK
jgi:HK97 family phage prohead protease